MVRGGGQVGGEAPRGWICEQRGGRGWGREQGAGNGAGPCLSDTGAQVGASRGGQLLKWGQDLTEGTLACPVGGFPARI